VALETGAVRDESEVIKWDGVERMATVWNQDYNIVLLRKNYRDREDVVAQASLPA